MYIIILKQLILNTMRTVAWELNKNWINVHAIQHLNLNFTSLSCAQIHRCKVECDYSPGSLKTKQLALTKDNSSSENTVSSLLRCRNHNNSEMPSTPFADSMQLSFSGYECDMGYLEKICTCTWIMLMLWVTLRMLFKCNSAQKRSHFNPKPCNWL